MGGSKERSKDTLDIKQRSDSLAAVPLTLKSCILIATPDGGKFVRKAKSVHFADTLGKPLKSIKTLYDLDDELDMVFLRFKDVSTRRNFSIKPKKTVEKNAATKTCGRISCQFVNFHSPIENPRFLEQVLKQHVLLEDVIVQESGILATINVKNVSFEKDVSITFTMDEWKTVGNIKANYVPGSSTGTIDIFSFELIIPENENNLNLQFAICYKTEGKEHWDSNSSKNYIISFITKNDRNKNVKVADSKYNGFVISKQEFIGWGS